MLLAQKETLIGKLIWGFVYECVSVRMYSWLAVSVSIDKSFNGRDFCFMQVPLENSIW